MEFRLLNADEIEARVSTVNDKGCSILLYKDARCDMNILDETVGPMNWKREHCRDNANCIVSLWDAEKQQWISKEDVGTESYTEAKKGLASDSFKRACFNWGIGRELYTAPFIWFGNKYVKIDTKGQRPTTRDRFRVDDIEYDDKRRIKCVTITNVSTRNTQKFYNTSPENMPVNSDKPTNAQFKKMREEMDRTGVTEKQIKDLYQLKSIRNDMTEGQILAVLRKLENTPDKS